MRNYYVDDVNSSRLPTPLTIASLLPCYKVQLVAKDKRELVPANIFLSKPIDMKGSFGKLCCTLPININVHHASFLGFHDWVG